MLRIDIPEFEIPAEIDQTIRTIVASRGVPGGEPSDTFHYHPEKRVQITVWSDALMEAARSIFRFAVSQERKRTSRLRGLANLDQALRIIRQDVAADESVPAEQKDQEAMRRAYQLGKAHVEMMARQG